MDDEFLIEDIPFDDELTYSFASHEVHKKIMKGWKQLKAVLPQDEEYADQIQEFDKLLNYFFE